MSYADSDSLEKTANMLPQNPPPTVVRAAGWLIVAVFAAGLAGAIFIEIPETVRCKFELVPESGADPVQAPYAAVLETVSVVEMQEVEVGDSLFVLRSDEFRRRDTEVRSLTEDLRARREKVEKLDAAHLVELTIFDEQLKQIEGEIEYLAAFVEANRKFRDTLAGLAANGAISKLQLDRQELALTEAEKDYRVAGRTLEQTKLERHKATVERARRLDEDSAEINKHEQKIGALREDLENASGSLLTIRAPYDAVVISLVVRNVGGVVEAGSPLCHLARRDAAPVARLQVGEEGVSRLAAGQTVRLFFEGFPYQRFGTVTSRIEWVSPAAVSSADGPRFTASARPDHLVIQAHGRSNPLRIGMQGEARAVVGRRALIEYAFEPIRRLRENLRQE